MKKLIEFILSLFGKKPPKTTTTTTSKRTSSTTTTTTTKKVEPSTTTTTTKKPDPTTSTTTTKKTTLPPTTSTTTTTTQKPTTSTTTTSTTPKPTTTTSTTTIYKFDTEISFKDANYFYGNGISLHIKNSNPNIRFEYNTIKDIVGMPRNMDIVVNGELEMVVAFYEDYLGEGFRFTSTKGVVYEGLFIDGTKNY
jgi:sulfite reductase alpha subunit-like flavoprotein